MPNRGTGGNRKKAAKGEAPPATAKGRSLPKARSGAVHRVRKNFGPRRDKMLAAVCTELRRFQRAGRIPPHLFVTALQFVIDEINDEQYDRSPSWTDGEPEARWVGGSEHEETE